MNTHAFTEDWRTLILSENDIKSLEFIVKTLKPFKDATLVQSKSKKMTTLSECSPIYEFLLSNLTTRVQLSLNEMPELTEGLRKAKQKLMKYYDKMNVIANLATILDPRHKLRFFEKAWSANEDDVLGLKEQLEQAIDYYKDGFSIVTNEENHQEATNTHEEATIYYQYLAGFTDCQQRNFSQAELI